MKKVIIAVAICLFITLVAIISVNAGETKKINGDSRFGCISKEIYEKLVHYAVQGDNEAFQKLFTASLLTGQCIPFKNGEPVYLDKVKLLSGMVKIRPKGEVQSYWTSIEAVK